MHGESRERPMAGEFQELIKRLAPDEEEFLENGRKEVEELAAE